MRCTFRGEIKHEGFHGARSESPHGWRGGEGGWVGVPRQRRTWVASLGVRDGGNFTRQPRDAHSAAGNSEDGDGAAKRNPNTGRPRGCGGGGAPASAAGSAQGFNVKPPIKLCLFGVASL